MDLQLICVHFASYRCGFVRKIEDAPRCDHFGMKSDAFRAPGRQTLDEAILEAMSSALLAPGELLNRWVEPRGPKIGVGSYSDSSRWIIAICHEKYRDV